MTWGDGWSYATLHRGLYRTSGSGNYKRGTSAWIINIQMHNSSKIIYAPYGEYQIWRCTAYSICTLQSALEVNKILIRSTMFFFPEVQRSPWGGRTCIRDSNHAQGPSMNALFWLNWLWLKLHFRHRKLRAWGSDQLNVAVVLRVKQSWRSLCPSEAT